MAREALFFASATGSFHVRDLLPFVPIDTVDRVAADIVGLFDGLRPIYFGVSEHDGFDLEGNAKHWHVLRQVLIKP